MQISIFAETRLLTIAKAKELVKTVLNLTVPKNNIFDLEPDQVASLDLALATAGEQINPSGSPEIKALVAQSELSEKKLDKVVSIVGLTAIKKNSQFYYTLLREIAQESLHYTAQIMEKFLEGQTSILAATYDRAARNTIAVMQELKAQPLEIENVSGTKDYDTWKLALMLELEEYK